jgi:hypothetical protein
VVFSTAFDAGGVTVTYQWQSSPDGTTWTDIASPGGSGSTNISPINFTATNIGVSGINVNQNSISSYNIRCEFM